MCVTTVAEVTIKSKAAGGPTGATVLHASKKQVPSTKEIMAAIPPECFKRDTAKSLMHAFVSTAMTLGVGLAAYFFLPLELWALPLWVIYAAVEGTIATGCWVVAHECGHNAFSDSLIVTDTVGYILHTVLLVPYYSWQRSHAVHHSRTNHLTEGETHVPDIHGKAVGSIACHAIREVFGESVVGVWQCVTHLLFGWPAYLLLGMTGGTARGVTNHFIPFQTSPTAQLYPGKWKLKVLASDVGIAATIALLFLWARSEPSGWWKVAAVYGGPYLGVNFWLVLYTWLQHTDVDVPHLAADQWTWEKGAFLTIDRPYGPVLDFLHHRIGSTHAAHHVCSRIPHYNAVQATEALKKAFPDFYLYDPTPVHKALWRVATNCYEVHKSGDLWVWGHGETAVAAGGKKMD